MTVVSSHAVIALSHRHPQYTHRNPLHNHRHLQHPHAATPSTGIPECFYRGSVYLQGDPR